MPPVDQNHAKKTILTTSPSSKRLRALSVKDYYSRGLRWLILKILPPTLHNTPTHTLTSDILKIFLFYFLQYSTWVKVSLGWLSCAHINGRLTPPATSSRVPEIALVQIRWNSFKLYSIGPNHTAWPILINSGAMRGLLCAEQSN